MDGNLKDGNLIEKSKALVWARFRDYTGGELRLLEAYLSKINPRDPESSRVTFTLAEYVSYLGLPELDSRNIKPQLKHFLGNVVMIDRPDYGKQGFEAYTLFTRATCEKDVELGQYIISISCNPELKDVFFNLAESRYIRYRLRYTKDMKSQYSIRLYSMLRDYLKKGSWDVSINRLREDLGATEKSYLVLRDFKKRVLDTAVCEINQISDLKVSYTNITKGRKVTDIHFTINLKPSQKVIEAEAKTASAEHGGNWYAEALGREVSSAQALTIVHRVQKNLADLHPEISIEKREQTVWDILHRAYSAQLEEKRDIRDAGAYFYSILKDISAIDEYLPATYGKVEF